MKGPSLDAIRKFKEQQERKKKEDEERKIKEKLSILEYRASNGDRKAKQNLKKLEATKEERNKVQPPISKPPVSKPLVKPKRVETDFEELMKLAKQNTNEIKKPAPPPSPQKPLQKPLHKPPERKKKEKYEKPEPTPKYPKIIIKEKPPITIEYCGSSSNRSYSSYRNIPSTSPNHYEDDDFVVEDDDDDDVRDELQKTLKSVFRYDKRRCDRREEELDRQYRAIGKVSTFEDLEREERRATRLAQEEDAKAYREEEERKRLKKLRLKGKS